MSQGGAVGSPATAAPLPPAAAPEPRHTLTMYSIWVYTPTTYVYSNTPLYTSLQWEPRAPPPGPVRHSAIPTHPPPPPPPQPPAAPPSAAPGPAARRPGRRGGGAPARGGGGASVRAGWWARWAAPGERRGGRLWLGCWGGWICSDLIGVGGGRAGRLRGRGRQASQRR